MTNWENNHERMSNTLDSVLKLSSASREESLTYQKRKQFYFCSPISGGPLEMPSPAWAMAVSPTSERRSVLRGYGEKATKYQPSERIAF
ncbi:MAG: hypothetical protein HQK55_12480 [Deltaproteobacteria bacterium]|nr:hypothetical protein [Deltaproteobacteria bacterium]